MCEYGCAKLTIAFAAEGTPEESGAIQHNLPIILQPDFVCASDGQEGLKRIKAAGPVVVSASHKLPYAPGTFDLIIVNGAPVCHACGAEDLSCEVPPSTYLGPVYCLHQLKSLLKECGQLEIGEECFVKKDIDGNIHSGEFSL